MVVIRVQNGTFFLISKHSSDFLLYYYNFVGQPLRSRRLRQACNLCYCNLKKVLISGKTGWKDSTWFLITVCVNGPLEIVLLILILIEHNLDTAKCVERPR